MSAENKEVVEAKKEYKVIAGTFRDLGKANKRLDKIKGAKIEGFDKKSVKKNCGTYTVLVASFATKDAAQKVQTALTDLQIESTIE